MQSKKDSPIRRRILPSTPLVLMLEEPGGGNYRLELKLAFDMNAGAAIQERTADPRANFRGYMLTDLATWAHISEPRLLKAMLWGAMLAHQPEYDSDEGFDTVGTFIQESNAKEIIAAIEKAYFAYLPKDRAEAIQKMRDEPGDDAKAPLDLTPAPQLMDPSGKTLTGSTCGPSPVTTSDSASKSSAA